MNRLLWRVFVGILILTTIYDESILADRIRGVDGTLNLLVAVPLTKDNQTVLDPGWFHMAAALLAVDRFNSKNCSGLPALCPLQECRMEFGNVVAIDTGTNNHQAMEFVVEQLLLKTPEEWAVVDAIAGPYHELPALELSVLATGLQAPMVSHRALDSTLLNPARHPYFSQVNADFPSEMQFVVRYLKHVQRPNFVAILYSSTASALQKVDLLGTLLDREGFDRVRTFSYRAKGDAATDTRFPLWTNDDEDGDRSVADALERIQATGYRTIYVLPGQLDTDLPEIGMHATRLGLNEGGHFWIVGGGAEQMSSTEIVNFLEQEAQSNSTIVKGAAYLYPVDHEPPVDLAYHTKMWRQSTDFFQRVQDMLPTTTSTTIDFDETVEAIEKAFVPMMQAPSDNIRWWNGASYMYDAVMTIGLGACKALEQANKTTTTGFTGKQHLDGIRATEFDGASGHIKFGNPSAPGSRDSNTIFFGVMNILPNGNEAPLFVQTEVFNPETGEWEERVPFVYADGTNRPPALLRDIPEMNYITPSVRAFGLTLAAIALVLVFLSGLWVFLNRNHSVVIAAQPLLLYSICLGSTMSALAILMYSYDESYDADEDMLSRMCVANIWMDAVGHIVVFGALFTKLWRVNRCMRYTTNQIELWRVIWPCVLLFLLVVILLSLMTASGDFRWERYVLDEMTGESIGFCNADPVIKYLAPIYSLHFIPTILAGIMAWKTSDIDDLYSESKWVLAFILVQVQVLVVAAPVNALVHDVSSDIRFVSYSLLMFTFPVSSMGLIFLPKIVVVRRMTKNAEDGGTNELEGNQQQGAGVLDGSTDRLSNHNINSSTPTPPCHDEARSPRPSRGGPRIQVVTFD